MVATSSSSGNHFSISRATPRGLRVLLQEEVEQRALRRRRRRRTAHGAARVSGERAGAVRMCENTPSFACEPHAGELPLDRLDEGLELFAPCPRRRRSRPGSRTRSSGSPVARAAGARARRAGAARGAPCRASSAEQLHAVADLAHRRKSRSSSPTVASRSASAGAMWLNESPNAAARYCCCRSSADW